VRYPLKNLLCYFYSPKTFPLLFIFFIIYIIYKRNEPESEKKEKNKLTFRQKLISIIVFFILFIALISDYYGFFSLILITLFVVGFLFLKGNDNKTGYVFYALCTIFSFAAIRVELSDFFSSSSYTVSSTNRISDYEQKEDVYSPVSGTIAQIGNKKLPSTFSKDSIVIDYPFEYKYKNKKMNVNYQIILSGVKSRYKAGETVARACILGTAAKKQKKINIRCKDFDPYLVSIAGDKPVFKDGWYYFGADFFMKYSRLRVLDYPLAVNKNHIIEFSDCSETFENLYKKGLHNKEENPVEVRMFPYFNICLKTKLESYPVPVKQFSASEKPIKTLIDKFYFHNCDYMIESVFDSIPVRYYFADKFYYLKNYYKTGEDIYLYCSAVCMFDDEIVFWVEDYTLFPPDEHVEACINRFKK